jgi:Leucine-rich repeat (LRR) protein
LSKLTELDLSFNRLTTLPKEMCKLKNLERIDLRGNNIDAESLGYLHHGVILI